MKQSPNQIVIKGARVHNLKNIDLEIPRDKLIVFTGLSGSGKSSLAFDTIYAEGQRRYIESLSAYARQFLGQMDKPDVDYIEGLSPSISIDQKSASHNPRSTVGTVTEIYDYLRLLYANIGIPHCPQCGKVIQKQSAQQIVDQVLAMGGEISILAPLVRGRKGEYREVFAEIQKEGYLRVRVDGKVRSLDEEIKLNKQQKHTIEIMIDRLDSKDDNRKRIADSVETALKSGHGTVLIIKNEVETLFSESLACPDCGISIEELSPRVFSFNNPFGACPECNGLGTKMEFDPELIFPEPDQPIRTSCKAINLNSTHYGGMAEVAAKHAGFTLDDSFNVLTPAQKKVLLHGTDEKLTFSWNFGNSETSKFRGQIDYDREYEGVIGNLRRRYLQTQSEEMRENLRKFMSDNLCPVCNGKRLKPEVLAVTIGEKNINEFTALTVGKARDFIKGLALNKRDTAIAHQVFKEISERLTFLVNVGLDYISLDRTSSTLSGGESQRIRLATQIGSGLVGVLYILDEPSIGLHQRDNTRLIETLRKLRELGNTVIVVEHDHEMIESADFIVDLGLYAGKRGGEIVATGTPKQIAQSKGSLTGDYLSGRKSIAVPKVRRTGNGLKLGIFGAVEHNLKNVDVEIPLGCFVAVTGVSGSGKSTLVNDILYTSLAQKFYHSADKPGKHRQIKGLENIDKVIIIDQSPIGRTPRSNPATYTGVFTPIRELFAMTPEAKVRGYKAGRFSFNVKGGRCEACQGDGIVKIEMHFLADVYVPCEVCKGKRYNRETLEVTYKGKNIHDVLEMTVEEAYQLFQNIPHIAPKLLTLQEVGLGYIHVGQSSTTLSGGEAQRVKLATELSKRGTGKTLYILDEPTTGLHFYDIQYLLDVLNRLVEQGNTVLVIEHNLDVIKTADYLIDLGPEGGDRGGEIMGVGTPEELAKDKNSYTGQYLKELLK